MIEKILDYQKLDAELFKLEQKLNNHEEKKNIGMMVQVIKDAQAKSIALDKEAKALNEELEKLKSVQEKGLALVERFSKQDIKKLGQAELKEMEQKVNQAFSQLNELDHRLTKHTQKVQKVLAEFENTKKKAMLARKKHQESKDAYEKVVAGEQGNLNKIKEKLESLEKQQNPELLAKYKNLRHDKIFPAVVPLVDKRCGGCRMELPSNSLEKLKDKGTFECEQCRRIIYIDKK